MSDETGSVTLDNFEAVTQAAFEVVTTPITAPITNDPLAEIKARMAALEARIAGDVTTRVGALEARFTGLFEHVGNLTDDHHEVAASVGIHSQMMEGFRTFMTGARNAMGI